jgi:N-methylhydantoinase B
LAGGSAGKRGKNELIRREKKSSLPGKCAFHAEPGDILRIETPGGGGWGTKKTSKQSRGK